MMLYVTIGALFGFGVAFRQIVIENYNLRKAEALLAVSVLTCAFLWPVLLGAAIDALLDTKP